MSDDDHNEPNWEFLFIIRIKGSKPTAEQKPEKKKPPRFKWLTDTIKGVAIPTGTAVFHYILNHSHAWMIEILKLWHHFF